MYLYKSDVRPFGFRAFIVGLVCLRERVRSKTYKKIFNVKNILTHIGHRTQIEERCLDSLIKLHKLHRQDFIN